MKYSIIIPTLNEELLLPKLLEQISKFIAKNKYEIELIISDGGSKDSTITIASRYTNNIIKNKSNRQENISIGRNKGARLSNGDILIFTNADIMFADIDLFFDEIDHVLKNPNYIAYTCAVEIHPLEKIFSDKLFLSFYNYYFHFLNIIGVGMGRGECQVIRKEIFELSGGYNENIVAGEDFDLFKRVRKIGHIYFSHKNKIYESPRRYRKYGHIFIFFSWLMNSIFVYLKNRSLSKNWEEIR